MTAGLTEHGICRPTNFNRARRGRLVTNEPEPIALRPRCGRDERDAYWQSPTAVFACEVNAVM